jgi:hypothetical protein
MDATDRGHAGLLDLWQRKVSNEAASRLDFETKTSHHR